MKRELKCDLCSRDLISRDDYMLRSDLWRTVSPRGRYFLCLECLKKKLKRKLVASDFTVCITNYLNPCIPKYYFDVYLETIGADKIRDVLGKIKNVLLENPGNKDAVRIEKSLKILLCRSECNNV